MNFSVNLLEGGTIEDLIIESSTGQKYRLVPLSKSVPNTRIVPQSASEKIFANWKMPDYCKGPGRDPTPEDIAAEAAWKKKQKEWWRDD